MPFKLYEYEYNLLIIYTRKNINYKKLKLVVQGRVVERQSSESARAAVARTDMRRTDSICR